MKNIALITLALTTPLIASALTFSGVISKSDGTPISNSKSTLELIIHSDLCVLYSETQDINLSSNRGEFSVQVGAGNPIFNVNGLNVFASKAMMCLDGSVVTPEGVKLKANVNIGGEIIDAGDYLIPKVATAHQADQIGGLGPDSFIQVKDSVSQDSVRALVELSTLITATANGLSPHYVKTSDIPAFSPDPGKLDKSANLGDLTDIAAARDNLGLGSLATKNTVSDLEIASVDFSKLTGVPSLAPQNHNHALTDITDLQSTLAAKVNNSSLIINCNPNQTVFWNSIPDTYECRDILLPYSQISGAPSFAASTHNHVIADIAGLGSLAAKSVVSDADIASVDFSKIANIPSYAAASHSHSVSDVSGLGPLAVLNSIGDAQISSVAWSKIVGAPSVFVPEAHQHSASDISSGIIAPSQLPQASETSDGILNQIAQVIAGTKTFASKVIASAGLDVVGDILTTGTIQVGTGTCSSSADSGKVRYNAGTLEVCDGSIWQIVGHPNPVGTVIAYAGTACPAGYLEAISGKSVKQSEYSSLHAIIGSSHGNGSSGLSGSVGCPAASGCFNLPKYAGRFLRGVANGSTTDPDRASRTAMSTGGATGDNVGSVQGHAYQTHNHGITDPGHSHVLGVGGDGYANGTVQRSANVINNYNTNSATTGITINNASPSGGASQASANETRPANANVLFCIKY